MRNPTPCTRSLTDSLRRRRARHSTSRDDLARADGPYRLAVDDTQAPDELARRFTRDLYPPFMHAVVVVAGTLCRLPDYADS